MGDRNEVILLIINQYPYENLTSIRARKNEVVISIIQKYRELKAIEEELVFIYKSTKEYIPMNQLIDEINYVEMIEVVPRYQSHVFHLEDGSSFRKEVDYTMTLSEVMQSIGYEGYVTSEYSDCYLDSFSSKYYLHRSPILMKQKNINSSTGVIPFNDVRRRYFHLMSMLCEKPNALTLSEQMKLSVLNELIEEKISLPSLFVNDETKVNYMKKHTIPQLKKECDKLYYSLGRKIQKKIPFHYQHLISYEKCVEMGKLIVQFHRVPKMNLMFESLEVFHNSLGIPLKTIISVTSKNTSILAITEKELIFFKAIDNNPPRHLAKDELEKIQRYGRILTFYKKEQIPVFAEMRLYSMEQSLEVYTFLKALYYFL